MEYGLTSKLQKYLRVIARPATAMLDRSFCWDIDYIKSGKVNMIAAVNTNSRLCAVAIGMKKQELKVPEKFIEDMIRQLLASEGYLKSEIGRYFALGGKQVFTKTHGRKAVSCMNRAIADMFARSSYYDEGALFQKDWSMGVNGDVVHAAGLNDKGVPREFFLSDMRRLGLLEDGHMFTYMGKLF